MAGRCRDPRYRRAVARTIETEIEIDAPIDAVWSVLSDWASYPDWNPWMVQLEGALEVGARLEVGMMLGRRRVVFRPRLVHVQPGRAFRWLGHMLVPGLFDGEHGFELVELGPAKTRFVHSERFRGVLAGLVLRAVGEATEQGFGQMNAALKARCETDAGSAPSSA